MATDKENDLEKLPEGCTPLTTVMIDGKEMQVVLAPGALDSFEGTPEELAELMAEVRGLVESGELFEKGKEVTDPETLEMLMNLDQQRNTRQ